VNFHRSFSCRFPAPRTMKMASPLGQGGTSGGFLDTEPTHPGAPRHPSIGGDFHRSDQSIPKQHANTNRKLTNRSNVVKPKRLLPAFSAMRWLRPESHGIGSHDCRAFCGYRGFSRNGTDCPRQTQTARLSCLPKVPLVTNALPLSRFFAFALLSAVVDCLCPLAASPISQQSAHVVLKC
jgi:hypothetical protein